MPYEEYLASASTSIFVGGTYALSTNSPSFTQSTSFSESGEGGCGAFGALGTISFSSTFASSVSSVGGEVAGGGLYSYSRLGSSSSSSFSSFAIAFGYSPACTDTSPATTGGASASAGQTDSESQQTSFGNKAITISGDNVVSNTNQGGEASQKTKYSFTASWNTQSLIFAGSGTQSITNFYSNTDTMVNETTTYPYNGNIPDYFFNYKTTTTTLEVGLNKTTEVAETFYGPLEDSTTEYSQIINTNQLATLSNIRATIQDSPLWSVQGLSRTFNIQWLGYAGGGAQALGLVYTSTGVDKNISPYDAVLIETDSFASVNQGQSFAYGASFSDDTYEGDTYTVTYDSITTAELSSQTTLLERETISDINLFSYGFIKTYTTGTTIYTAGTLSETIELVSYSKQGVFTYDTSAFAVSGVSFSEVRTKSTTSGFTQFIEISGANKATSFSVRSLITTTASYSYRSNTYGITIDNAGNPNGRSYTFAPVFVQSSLVVRSPVSSNPDTFYTEVASFASFADPSYTSPYTGYLPPACSLVFVNLIALNDTAEEGKYPSWISVYDGTFSGNDRATTSLESVTVNQSSSYVGVGSTNVYQTINYFIANNTNSLTTKTTSVAMVLNGVGSSVSRLIRTKVDNLDSAYINSYLPPISLDGLNVVFTKGLQTTAGYNINKLLMNAYTTAKSTFADSATSSFPVSKSSMNLHRNKIRIDRGYNIYPQNNSFQIGLLRYVDQGGGE